MLIAQATRILILSAIAFLVALASTPIWYRFLIKYQIKKQIRPPENAPIFAQMHQNKAGTPTAGGIIFWSTTLGLALFFWLAYILSDGFWQYFNFVNRAETYLPLAALSAAAVLGLIDDWLGFLQIGPSGGGLKIRHKLIIYAGIAAIGAWWFFSRLGWDVINVPFLGNFEIGFWYIPIFMFIMIASAFSANETDGLDGLLGGVAFFAFLALTVVAFVLGRYDLATFSGVLSGSLLAFLWFNIYPAKFFMGDTGSMSIGITLGIIALLTNTVLLLPFFLIIPVAESVSVIIQLASKKLRGKKVFLSTPLHHHFEALGWPESKVTMRFWIISAVSVAFGLAIFFLSRLL